MLYLMIDINVNTIINIKKDETQRADEIQR